MAKIKVAVFDTDKGYRERFADYLLSYKASDMELSVFTNEEFFFEALNVDKFHLLVLGCGYEEVLLKIKVRKIPILVLTEYVQSYVRESVGMVDEQVVYTSKYQSMDVITKKMQLLTERKRERNETGLFYREVEIVGVFSPVKHEMQMLFSLLYTKNAARNRKVLYINLLEFSGFSELFGNTEYDLGDAILQVREKNGKPEHLRACIYENGNFSYISPCVNPENVKEVTGDDVRRLLELIAEYMDFETVVLDVGLNVTGFAEVLMACTKIFSLGKKGYLFEAQSRQFFSYLEKAVDEVIRDKVEQIEIPGQLKVVCGGVNLLEQLDWGEFGDFVRTKV